MKAPDVIHIPYKDGKIIGLVKDDGLPFKNCDGNIQYLKKKSLVAFIEDAIAENLENTTEENHDNHEGYHQACWDILYYIKQMCRANEKD